MHSVTTPCEQPATPPAGLDYVRHDDRENDDRHGSHDLCNSLQTVEIGLALWATRGTVAA